MAIGLADILEAVDPSGFDLSCSQQKAWRAIVSCRTATLGGHVECCDHCGALRQVYHSCRNRHCPRCQTRAKEAWLAARRRELLPVPYFHLVFTLPHKFNAMASDLRLLYELLFGSVSQTLNEFAANPRWLGGTPAFSLVLHTWKQDLGRHLHVHALMAGGALTATGEWIATKQGYLFPVQALSTVFRGKFMGALDEARKAGRIRHEMARIDRQWRAFRDSLYLHDWVVYAKAPLGGPAQVLEYLGRYTHRVAICNDRILGMEHGMVRFRMRDSANGNRKKLVRMEAREFARRFLLHVLPGGFKRIRHYGLLGPAHKAEKLAAARAALSAPAPDPLVTEPVEAFLLRVAGIEWMACPHCGTGHFHVLSPIEHTAIPGNHGPP